MEIYRNRWRIYGNQLKSMDIHGNPQEIYKFYANQLEINWDLWKTIENHRKFIEINGNSLEINEIRGNQLEIHGKSMGINGAP